MYAFQFKNKFNVNFEVFLIRIVIDDETWIYQQTKTNLGPNKHPNKGYYRVQMFPQIKKTH